MSHVAVCTARPRPSVQNSRSRFGSQWWRRDVYHLRGDGARTLCGRDCTEWLVVGDVEELDHNCCTRCAAKAETSVRRG